MKILTVVGARPQFIKAAMFARAILNAKSEGHDELVEEIVHTGQHYDFEMSDAFFQELSIPEPVANLNVCGGTHGEMTGAMLPLLEQQIMQRKPDLVVVIGDTNSTMAGALAAAKLNVPVGHIEAGMRHYKRDIPEEINRVVTDHLCQLLFCSSGFSRRNLEREGITQGVYVPGDIGIDLLWHQWPRRERSTYEQPYVVCTIHRAANTDDEQRLRSIFTALAACPHHIVLPLHPRTRNAMQRFDVRPPENVEIRPPVSSSQMLGLLERCEFVMTDSGGLQKEAYFCAKRCITLSEVTPWQELIDLDADRLVGADCEAITAAYEWARQPLETTKQPYGDGTAAEKMVRVILDEFA